MEPILNKEYVEQHYTKYNIDIRLNNSLYVNYVKPCIDVTFATLLLVLLLPLFLIISIIIRLDSEGPAIFKQARIGKNGREFIIYKFRTMYISAPSQGRSPTSDDDPRITKVGKLLRKTSLDELPQLINIIRGDMSFIGPRPEQKDIVDKYYGEYERQRHLVKPGITGLWQISKDRTKPIHENLHYDFYYINNLSFLLDVKIVIGTIKVMLLSNTC